MPQPSSQTPASPRRAGPPLLTFEFLGLCLLIFLAYSNISVFYSLYVHLEAIGVDRQWRGLLIGSSSLSTILCFLAGSAFLGPRNASRCILAGIGLLVACGWAYLHARSGPSLLLVRVLNGAGIYLVSASAMTLLVAVIPRDRSGQAFGIYSAAMLLPYSVIPLVFDRLGPRLPSLAHGYALMSLALVPAALVNLALARRRGRLAEDPARAVAPPVREVLANLAAPRIWLLLLVNAVYYLSFASLFFLAKPLFLARGSGDVGAFFTIQTACMIAIRLLGNRIFDTVSKVLLIRVCYALTGLGFGIIALTGGPAALTLASLVLGVGMGLGVPSLNALMFGLSEPRFRGVNANMMMMSLQFGSFCGPFLGSWSVDRLGYGGFLLVGLAANVLGLALSLYFTRTRTQAPGRAAGPE